MSQLIKAKISNANQDIEDQIKKNDILHVREQVENWTIPKGKKMTYIVQEEHDPYDYYHDYSIEYVFWE